MTLSLVVPCYNEEETVERLYDEFYEVFCAESIDFEVIFADDGSTDSTLKKLRQIAAQNRSPVKIVPLSRNFGKDAGVFAGMKEAVGEFTVIIDADLQQQPTVVVEMVRFLQNNEDFECVAAIIKKRTDGCLLSWFKRRFYKTINRVSQIDFIEGASDFRCFRKSMRNAILQMEEYFRFSKGLFSYVGFNTHIIEYTPRERGGGVTKWSFSKLLRYAIDGIVGFSIAPLRFITVIGAIVSGASFIYLAVVIIQKLTGYLNEPFSGYPTLIVLILFLGGIQLLSLGIIGEYLGRNYIESKNRPVYFTKEIVKNEKAESQLDEEK